MGDSGVQTGILERAGRWMDDRWLAVVPAIGGIVMTICGTKLSSAHPIVPVWWWYQSDFWYWVLLCAGAVVIIVGTGLGIQGAGRASEMNQRIAGLSASLAEARDPKRVFLCLSAMTDDWQVGLEHNLLIQLRSHGFRPTVFAPLRNHSCVLGMLSSLEVKVLCPT